MALYTKKPVTVNAVQFFEDEDHPAVVVAALGEGFCVKGRQGHVKVNPGDWIIPELDGSGFYPCAPDIFEATYVPAGIKTTALSFGEAIVMLKAGARVCRTGWNGKSMWLALTEGTPDLPAEKFWNPHNRAFAERNGGSATVLPSITMKTATGEILMGWLASQTDMLADDWMVVPAEAA